MLMDLWSWLIYRFFSPVIYSDQGTFYKPNLNEYWVIKDVGSNFP